jgi:hypothetical protein
LKAGRGPIFAFAFPLFPAKEHEENIIAKGATTVPSWRRAVSNVFAQRLEFEMK